MIAFATLQVLMINTHEDFGLMNKNINDYFVLNTNLTFDVISQEVQFFKGTFSGAKNYLYLEYKNSNSKLFDRFQGSLRDIQIFVQSDYSINVLARVTSGSIDNIYMKITSKSDQRLLSPIGQISNSNLFNAQINIILNTRFNNKLSGLSSQFDNSAQNNVKQIQINITNQQKIMLIYGISENLNGAFQGTILINDKGGSEHVSGGCKKIGLNVQNLVIKIYSEAESIYGLCVDHGVNVIQHIEVQITSKNSINIFGVSSTGQGQIKMIQILIRALINVGEGVEIAGVCKNCAVQNAIVLLNCTIIAEDTMVGGISSKGDTLQVYNCSVILNLVVSCTGDNFVAGVFAKDSSSILNQIYVEIDLTGNGGKSRYGGVIGQSAKPATMNQIQIKFRYRSDTKTSKACWVGGIVTNLEKSQVSNVVVHIDLNVAFNKQVSLSAAVQQSKDCLFRNIVIQQNIVLIQSGTLWSYYSGFSEKLHSSRVEYFIITGPVQAQGRWVISGIVKHIQASDVYNGMINIQIINDKKGNVSYMIYTAILGNKIRNVIGYSRYSKTHGIVRLLPALMNDENVYELNLGGKKCGSNCVSEAQLKSPSFLQKLLKSEFWILDDLNQQMVHLVDFYGFSADNSLEINSLMYPFQLSQQMAILLDMPNLCAFDCHGFKNSQVSICETNYTGQNCENLDCELASCGSGTCSELGCQCSQFYSGQFCTTSLCTQCFNTQICNPSPFLTCQNNCQKLCNNGVCVNDFCACYPSFVSISSPCDSIRCFVKSDCNSMDCEGGICQCGEYSTGLSCENCISGLERIDGLCKLACINGFCEFGDQCYYESGIISDVWKCQDCQFPHTGQMCDQCEIGYELNKFQCMQKCQVCLSGECWFLAQCDSLDPNICAFICSSCIIPVSGNKCNQCPDQLIFYDWECRNQFFGGNGICLYIGTDIICLKCDENYVLIDKKCNQKCDKDICIFGTCLPDNSCQCIPGYIDLVVKCDTKDCSVNSCDSMFICVSNICQCQDNYFLQYEGCFQCPEIYNGKCNQTGITCDAGFNGEQCEDFLCIHPGDCNQTDCIDKECKCKDILYRYKGYCLDDCSLALPFNTIDFVQIQLVGNIHYASIYKLNSTLSDKSKSNICILTCPLCDCNGITCDCQNVKFIESDSGNICQGCIFPYSGFRCTDCVEPYLKINNGCVLKCEDCNGDCYENLLKKIECILCNDGYQGDQCDYCNDGFTKVGDFCFEMCQDCNGKQCYINEEEITCNICLPGYIGISCIECDSSSGYISILDGCYQGCPHCVQGDCYIVKDEIVCISCNNGLIGTQCSLCLDGFVLVNIQCLPQVTDDQCYIDDSSSVVCLKCNEDRILIDQVCYDRCITNSCPGECYYNQSSYNCISCNVGYILFEGHCVIRVPNPNGECIKNGQITVCTCYPGFTGQVCQSCAELEINFNCYVSANIEEGDCFYNANDVTDMFCRQCKIQYALPYCDSCALGYQKDPGGKCTICAPGFIDTKTLDDEHQLVLGTDACVAICGSCVQGECWYAGATILCLTCAVGYTGNCFECEAPTSILGSYCIKPGDCGESEATQEVFCQECESTNLSFNCSYCSLDFTFDECRVHAPMSPGRCYIQDNFIICNDEDCLLASISQETCFDCTTGLQLINGSCWQHILPEMARYRGECIISQNLIKCQACELGWSGDTCNSCVKGFTQCNCAIDQRFALCCCEMVLHDIGVCYIEEDTPKCNACNSGYLLDNEMCIKEILKGQWKIYVFPLILIFIIAICITIPFCLSKLKQNQLILFLKRNLRVISKRLIYVILAQILAIIIAFQDVYINDFYMQASTNLFSSMPFVVFYCIAALPKYKFFSYNHRQDYFIFLSVALIELVFHSIAYFLVPEQLEVSQSIYKLASPPVVLLMFIFFAGYKFRNIQIITIFIALSLPIIFQVAFAIGEATSPNFFSGVSAGTISLGQIMTGVDIIILGSQFYVYEVVLSQYEGLMAILRLAFANFLLYGVVFMIEPQRIIAAVFNTKVFIFCLGTQVIFNVVMVIVMLKISAVEFAINSITSAIWVEFFVSVGNYHEGNVNFVPGSLFTVIVTTFSLILVIAALIIFNCYSRRDNEVHNSMKQDGKKMYNGVHLVISDKLNKKKYLQNAYSLQVLSKLDPTTGCQSMKQFSYNKDTGIGLGVLNSTRVLQNSSKVNLSSLQSIGSFRNGIQKLQSSRSFILSQQVMPSFSKDVKITKQVRNLDVSQVRNLRVAAIQFDRQINKFDSIEDIQHEASETDYI
eukprot:EST43071.1 Transmembrane domain-containing protein [Spironucleus salmonicida]